MFVLKSDMLASCQPSATSENESGEVSTGYMQRGLRDFQQIVTILRGHVIGVVEDEWDDEDYQYGGDDFEEYAL